MEGSDLTARQQALLDHIRDHQATHGRPPTRHEIAAAFGYASVNAVTGHLKALAAKGAIELTPGAARGIRLVEEATGAHEAGLPLVGRVAAGAPILAREHIEARYRVDSGLFHPRPDYLLRVRGESMIEAGIRDGDLLAVHRAPEATVGQLVVARLGEEVTVKRLDRDDTGQPVLRAANPDYPDIPLTAADEAAIEGIGVGVLRTEP
ncbi:repressor LexA [Thiohalospira halophila DSM 15071]|uniref:LexA repressor n=1 Tax=Thiohalospira halophila DSM 15071 TaxID=1123397 RepID=A0A1I1NXF5_9GAMM|nr:transcriptional repressor LexA [Thiohalospira halophila]SFD02086.1 repressor LexA [Thiohalospira halophila DSM 15071]